MSNEKELLKKAAAVRKNAYWKHGLSAIFQLVTLAYMDIAVSHVQVHLFIARIGLVLMNVAIFVYLATSSDLLYLWIRPNRNDLTIQDHLQELIKLKRRLEILSGRFYIVYYCLMMTGLLLYAIEFTAAMQPLHQVITYVLICCWLLIFWFRLRPKIIKKHEKKIDAAIAELKRLSGQLSVSS